MDEGKPPAGRGDLSRQLVGFPVFDRAQSPGRLFRHPGPHLHVRLEQGPLRPLPRRRFRPRGGPLHRSEERLQGPLRLRRAQLFFSPHPPDRDRQEVQNTRPGRLGRHLRGHSLKLIRFFAERPVASFMIYAILSLLGVVSLLRMPVDLLPGSDSGVLTIFVGIRGGLPPEDIESLVTKPVEDEMATLPNLESITSVSRKERAVITLSFKIGTDSARAALEVQERLAKIRGKLPREIEKPVVSRYDESQSPVIIFALSSKHFTPEQMREIADNSLKPLLLQQEGVANVEIGGGRERKILAEFDKNSLEAHRLPTRQVK